MRVGPKRRLLDAKGELASTLRSRRLALAALSLLTFSGCVIHWDWHRTDGAVIDSTDDLAAADAGFDTINIADAFDTLDAPDDPDATDVPVTTDVIQCDHVVVDPSSDSNNCGGCGMPCRGGQPCVGGTCGNVVQVAAGAAFTCALLNATSLSDGGIPLSEVRCWGENDHLELGGGSLLGTGVSTVPFVGVQPIAIAAATNHACAVTSDGGLYCWGWDLTGHLLGTGHTSVLMGPTRIPSIDSVLDVMTGKDFTCVLHDDGAVNHVICWGDNSYAELGIGSYADGGIANDLNRDPVLASTGTPIVPFNATRLAGVTAINRNGEKIAVGCAFGDNATFNGLYCWGGRATPAVVPLLGRNGLQGEPYAEPLQTTHVASAPASVGRSHACGVFDADGGIGSALCWGSGDSAPDAAVNYANLGQGPTGGNASIPQSVTFMDGGVLSATFVAAGDGISCAATPSNDVLCWGATLSVPGLGLFDYPSRIPVAAGGDHIIGIAIGGYSRAEAPVINDGPSVCTYTARRVVCQGANLHGQSGLPATAGSSLAATVVNLTPVVH